MTSRYCIEFTAVLLAVSFLAIESHGQAQPKGKASAKVVTATSAKAAGMSLQEFLQAVQKNNGSFRAIDAGREAAAARREGGDRDLSPIFNLGANNTDDQRPVIMGGLELPGSKTKDVSMGLSKKFSTGTQVSLSASANEIEQTTPAGFLGTAGGTTRNALGGMGVTISQSLWKDFFGEATDLRRERESMVEKTELQGLNLQSREILVNAEAAFWDNLYLKEELRQREDALARSKRIESWVKNRASNGIGDRADVLNAQGLVAARELQLLTAQDELKASDERLRDVLEIGQDVAVPNLIGNMDAVRSVKDMLEGDIRVSKSEDAGLPNNQVVRLDAYLSILEAKTKSVVAQETSESLKPDLKLEGAYKTNSVDTSLSGAMNNISDTDKPTTRVGVNFVYMIDDGAKGATRRAADLDATVAKQKRDRKLLESRTAWSELLRRHQEMTVKIAAAERMASLQTEEADAERDKLSKGRSVTSTVIIAEQEAAEGQLTLAKMRAEQRKLESQARMFIQLSEAQ